MCILIRASSCDNICSPTSCPPCFFSQFRCRPYDCFQFGLLSILQRSVSLLPYLPCHCFSDHSLFVTLLPTCCADSLHALQSFFPLCSIRRVSSQPHTPEPHLLSPVAAQQCTVCCFYFFTKRAHWRYLNTSSRQS